MRILFVSNFYPPQSLGGVQLYTHGLATQFQQRGHQVQVFCVGDWDIGEANCNGTTNSIHEGIAVRRLHLNWCESPDPFRYLYDNPVAAAEMERLLTEFQPDVVHVTSCANLSASVILTAQQKRIPVILTLADYWFICPRFTLQHGAGHICNAAVTPWECTRCLAWNAKVYRWPSKVMPQPVVQKLLSWVGKRPGWRRQKGLIGLIGDMEERRHILQSAFASVDVVLAISQYLKDVFVASGQLPGHKIRVHEWGLPAMDMTLDERVEPNSPLRFAYFGRLAANKGVHILIEAFQQLSGDAELHIYGDTSSQQDGYRQQLKQLAHNNPQIVFHGSYQRNDMAQLLRQTDVVVVPSLWPETYNLVAREALMAGVPVVASNIGALSEAVEHGKSGLLFETGNKQKLATVLQQLINDSKLRICLASHERRLKTVTQECGELISIYESLVQ